MCLSCSFDSLKAPLRYLLSASLLSKRPRYQRFPQSHFHNPWKCPGEEMKSRAEISADKNDSRHKRVLILFFSVYEGRDLRVTNKEDPSVAESSLGGWFQ